jgi:hypothetical protein
MAGLIGELQPGTHGVRRWASEEQQVSAGETGRTDTYSSQLLSHVSSSDVFCRHFGLRQCTLLTVKLQAPYLGSLAAASRLYLPAACIRVPSPPIQLRWHCLGIVSLCLVVATCFTLILQT